MNSKLLAGILAVAGILLAGFVSAQSFSIGDVFTQAWDILTGNMVEETTTTTVTTTTTTLEVPLVKESREEGSVSGYGIATQEVTTTLPYHETKESAQFEVVPVQEYNISIYPGWNFISTPYQLVNETLESFVEGIDWDLMWLKNPEYCDDVYYCWLSNKVGQPYEINEISNLLGYWVNVTENDNITAVGIHYYTEIGIPLYKSASLPNWDGWNIIGYPRNHTIPVMDLTSASLGSNWSLLEEYENGDWDVADQRIPQVLWSLKNITPGRAYYIKMIEDDTLIIPETTRPY